MTTSGVAARFVGGVFFVSATAFAQAVSIHYPLAHVFTNSCTGEPMTLTGNCHQVINLKQNGDYVNEWNCHEEGLSLPSGTKYVLDYNAHIQGELDFATCEGQTHAEARELIVSQGAMPNQNVLITADCKLIHDANGVCVLDCSPPELQLECPGSPASP